MKHILSSLLLIIGVQAADTFEHVQICFFNPHTKQIGAHHDENMINFPVIAVQPQETSNQAAKSWCSTQKLTTKFIYNLCDLRENNIVTYVKLAVMTDQSSKVNKHIVWGPFIEKPNQNQKSLAPEIIAMQNLMMHLLQGARMRDTTDTPHDIPMTENHSPKTLEDFNVLLKAYGEEVTGELTLDPSFRDLYARTYVQSKVRPWLDLSDCTIS